MKASECQISCCPIDPRHVKGFVQSEGLKAQTDSIDTRLIEQIIRAIEKQIAAESAAIHIKA